MSTAEDNITDAQAASEAEHRYHSFIRKNHKYHSWQKSFNINQAPSFTSVSCPQNVYDRRKVHAAIAGYSRQDDGEAGENLFNVPTPFNTSI